MGVTQLWQVLAPVERHQSLASLEGLTLAVDLSIWVCETQSVKQMQGVVSKPFLRNLFFRITHLTQLGVKLVFVIEGTAPALKWDVMMQRQQTRYPGRQPKQPSQKPISKQTRRNFNACLKECCELLEILGIPYVQSQGEAEAMCALLNAAGIVDGCLTNDGDAFLYGARTVYRNFTMNIKDPHVETYTMTEVELQLEIDRHGLVALGLLLGCDFVPKGVPGVGVANATKLLQSLRGIDVLERLQKWRKMSESQCVNQAETLVRRKALSIPDFPQMKVIQEFMSPKDRCPTSISPWRRPVLAKFQEFALIKMEWPIEYSLEKLLPLISLWDMQDVLNSSNPSTHQHLKPARIVKTRVRQGVPCYEVEWHKPVTDGSWEGDYYVTIEPQDLFSQCYPDLVNLLEIETAEGNKKKKKNQGKRKKKNAEKGTNNINDALDNLSFNFDKMNIGAVTETIKLSVKSLPASMPVTYDTQCNLMTKVKPQKHFSAGHAIAPGNTSYVDEYDTPEVQQMIVNSNIAASSQIVANSNSVAIGNTVATGNKFDLSNLVSPMNPAALVKALNSNQSVNGGHESEEENILPFLERVKLRMKAKSQSTENSATPKSPAGNVKNDNSGQHNQTSKKKNKKNKATENASNQSIQNDSKKNEKLTKNAGKGTSDKNITKNAKKKENTAKNSSKDSNNQNVPNSAKKENMSTPNTKRKGHQSGTNTPDLSDMNSLLEDIENLSLLQETAKRQHNNKSKQDSRSTPSTKSNSRLSDVSELDMLKLRASLSSMTPRTNIASPITPFGAGFKSFKGENFRKMSSPSCEDVCSPMSYMQKHSQELTESFEIRDSPINLEKSNLSKKQLKKARRAARLAEASKNNASQTPSSKTSSSQNKSGRSAESNSSTKTNSTQNKSGNGTTINSTQKSSGKSANKTNSAQTTSGKSAETNSTPKSSRTNTKTNTPQNSSVKSAKTNLSTQQNSGNNAKQKSTQKTNGKNTSVAKLSPQVNHTFNTDESKSDNAAALSDIDSSVLNEFGDFKIQTSLMNSLCASLVQAITPRGISKEEYDNLCVALNRIDGKPEDSSSAKDWLDSEINKTFDQMNIPKPQSQMNIHKPQSQFNLPMSIVKPQSITTNTDLRGVNLNLNSLTQTAHNQSSSSIANISEEEWKNLSKSARKKLKRKERLRNPDFVDPQNPAKCATYNTSISQLPIFASQYKTVSKPQTSVSSDYFRNCVKSATPSTLPQTQTLSLSSGQLTSNASTNKSITNSEMNPESISKDEVIDNENADEKVKKKKKKKKKVKKAKSDMNLSADDSFGGDLQSMICSNYLKKAIENMKMTASQKVRIEKASPVMDLSADDTILELDDISCQLAGSQSTMNLKTRLQIARKRSSLEKAKTGDDQGQSNQNSSVECNKVLSAYEIHRHLEPSCTVTTNCEVHEPVFSLNKAIDDENKTDVNVGSHETEMLESGHKAMNSADNQGKTVLEDVKLIEEVKENSATENVSGIQSDSEDTNLYDNKEDIDSTEPSISRLDTKENNRLESNGKNVILMDQHDSNDMLDECNEHVSKDYGASMLCDCGIGIESEEGPVEMIPEKVVSVNDSKMDSHSHMNGGTENFIEQKDVILISDDEDDKNDNFKDDFVDVSEEITVPKEDENDYNDKGHKTDVNGTIKDVESVNGHNDDNTSTKSDELVQNSECAIDQNKGNASVSNGDESTEDKAETNGHSNLGSSTNHSLETVNGHTGFLNDNVTCELLNGSADKSKDHIESEEDEVDNADNSRTVTNGHIDHSEIDIDAINCEMLNKYHYVKNNDDNDGIDNSGGSMNNTKTRTHMISDDNDKDNTGCLILNTKAIVNSHIDNHHHHSMLNDNEDDDDDDDEVTHSLCSSKCANLDVYNGNDDHCVGEMCLKLNGNPASFMASVESIGNGHCNGGYLENGNIENGFSNGHIENGHSNGCIENGQDSTL